MTRIPNTLTVRSDFPAKTAHEFIAYAKANPGKISYASQGNGTTSHLTGVMFEQATGTKLLHVPYRGTAPAINDLMGGHVDVLFNEVATSMEMNKSGRARMLAVTTPQRVPDLPDIPTMQEAGLAGFESDTWNAISAPPKTPVADRREAQYRDQRSARRPRDAGDAESTALAAGRWHAFADGGDRQVGHEALGRSHSRRQRDDRVDRDRTASGPARQ